MRGFLQNPAMMLTSWLHEKNIAFNERVRLEKRHGEFRTEKKDGTKPNIVLKQYRMRNTETIKKYKK